VEQTHLTGRETLRIRSFRVVFALERRLFKIERFRLPFAYGVPLRAIGYAAAALIVVALAGQLPVVGAVLGLVPPPLRFVALPVGVAALMTRVRVDGLPAHRFLVMWLEHRLTPRTLARLAPDRQPAVDRIAEPIVFEPDTSGPRLRRGVIVGARELALAVPARAEVHGTTLTLEQRSDRPLRARKRVRIPHGGRVVLR
jgi:hypothetical protein